jgi:hypothetical protein
MAPANQEDDGQVEIYRCTQELEVNRVIDELLGPAGFECFVHNRTVHMLPARGGAFFVAVRAGDASRARQLLAQARADGELDADSGELIDA